MQKRRLDLFSGLLHRLAVGWLVARESIKAFVVENGFEYSATLAYYGFLALMPLLLLVFFLVGLFLRSSDAILAAIDGLVRAAFPAFSSDILEDLLALTNQKTWGIIGTILLLWSIVPFTATIRYAMRQIFKAEPKRNFVLNKLFDVAAVVGLLSLFIALVAGKIFYALKAASISARVGLSFSCAGELFAPGLVVAALAFFYFVFCPVRLRLAELFSGSVAAALLLILIRPLFGWFLAFNPEYGYAFGSLKAIFLVLIWIYYSFAVILFGAVVIAVIRRREALLLKGLFHGAHVKASGLARLLLDKLTRIYWAGQNIFLENDPGREMFFVVAGAVDLRKGGKLLKRVAAGEYFGEMAMLLDIPRTTTATVAEEDTRLISINAGNFSVIMRENPDIVLALLKEMAERLKSTDLALLNAAGKDV